MTCQSICALYYNESVSRDDFMTAFQTLMATFPADMRLRILPHRACTSSPTIPVTTGCTQVSEAPRAWLAVRRPPLTATAPHLPHTILRGVARGRMDSHALGYKGTNPAGDQPAPFGVLRVR